jgi:hypothetical protein
MRWMFERRHRIRSLGAIFILDAGTRFLWQLLG